MNQKIKNLFPAKKILLLLVLVLGFWFLNNFNLANAADDKCQALGGTCQTSCIAKNILTEGNEYCENKYDDSYMCCKSSSNVCPSPKEGITSGFLVFKGSIVPCGRKCNDPNTENWDETKSCTLCHFFIIFKQVYDLFFSLIIIVAILLLTAGGVIYIVSAGRPGMKTLAKNIISKALIGFALFLLSWLLVYTILKFISAKTDYLGDGKNWNDFTCDTESVFDENTEENNNTNNTDYQPEAGEVY